MMFEDDADDGTELATAMVTGIFIEVMPVEAADALGSSAFRKES